jgi:hypothetical protein
MSGFAASTLAGLLLATYAYAASVPAVNLGSTENFSVVAGSTITNTGSSVIAGDIGLSPGTSVTGFPPATLQGTQHVADAEAAQAKVDLGTAYTDALGRAPAATIGSELGGSTILPGVYSAGTFGITGTVTLDAQGDANAVFIFKADSTLITAASSNVSLIGGAQACNVFWQVGSAATLGANSALKGTVLALTSITLTTGANVEGRVLARNGAVTLDSNTIAKATCATAPAVTPPPAATTTPAIAASTTPVTVIATTTALVAVTVPANFIPQLPITGGEPLAKSWYLMIASSLALLATGAGLLRRKQEIQT